MFPISPPSFLLVEPATRILQILGLASVLGLAFQNANLDVASFRFVADSAKILVAVAAARAYCWLASELSAFDETVQQDCGSYLPIIPADSVDTDEKDRAWMQLAVYALANPFAKVQPEQEEVVEEEELVTRRTSTVGGSSAKESDLWRMVVATGTPFPFSPRRSFVLESS